MPPLQRATSVGIMTPSRRVTKSHGFADLSLPTEPDRLPSNQGID
jgi:hypothetical protein